MKLEEFVYWPERPLPHPALKRRAERFLDDWTKYRGNDGLSVIGVFGSRGQGKSSLLRAAAVSARERGWHMPISESEGYGRSFSETEARSLQHEGEVSVFDPMKLEAGDDVLSDFLEYLVRVPSESRVSKVYSKIESLMAKRASVTRPARCRTMWAINCPSIVLKINSEEPVQFPQSRLPGVKDEDRILSRKIS